MQILETIDGQATVIDDDGKVVFDGNSLELPESMKAISVPANIALIKSIGHYSHKPKPAGSAE